MIDGKEYHSNLLKSMFGVYPEPVPPTLTPAQIFYTHTHGLTGIFLPITVPWPPRKGEVWSSDPSGPKPDSSDTLCPSVFTRTEMNGYFSSWVSRMPGKWCRQGHHTSSTQAWLRKLWIPTRNCRAVAPAAAAANTLDRTSC